MVRNELKENRRLKRLKYQNKFIVVITDYMWSDVHIEADLFPQDGYEFIAAHCQSEEDVIRIAGNADAIISTQAHLSKNAINSLKRCKIISVSGSDYSHFDVEAASSAGILLVNYPHYSIEEIADHTLALILSCARGVFLFDRRVRKKVWDFKSAGNLIRIRKSVLGLIGFGRGAQAVAVRAKSFGMEILVFDPFLTDDDIINHDIRRVGMQELLAMADFVSIHQPLGKAWTKLISKNELALMKNSAFIINTCFAGAIDDSDLYAALTSGTIRGAALDVLEKDPPDTNNKLLTLDNILVTPHVAFYSENAMDDVRISSAQAVVDVYNGMKPNNIINKEVLKNRNLRMTFK